MCSEHHRWRRQLADVDDADLNDTHDDLSRIHTRFHGVQRRGGRDHPQAEEADDEAPFGQEAAEAAKEAREAKEAGDADAGGTDATQAARVHGLIMKPLAIAHPLRRIVMLAATATLAAAAAATAVAAAPRVHGGGVAATQQLAVLNHDTEAFKGPRADSGSVGEVNEVRPITGERTVLPVVASSGGGGWLEVLLPGRPDSHTGWIEAAGVSRTTTTWHIEIDLAKRQVAVFESGRPVRTFSAVIGKPSTPTPTGSFFVEETVPLAPSAGGAPFALALSARSNALAEFDGGPGQVALHGVAGIGGVPGTAVSHGCVRLSTLDITWLGEHISSGVPVTITG